MKHAAWPLDILLVQGCRSILKFEPYLLLSAFSPFVAGIVFFWGQHGRWWLRMVQLCCSLSRCFKTCAQLVAFLKNSKRFFFEFSSTASVWQAENANAKVKHTKENSIFRSSLDEIRVLRTRTRMYDVLMNTELGCFNTESQETHDSKTVKLGSTNRW